MAIVGLLAHANSAQCAHDAYGHRGVGAVGVAAAGGEGATRSSMASGASMGVVPGRHQA
jgi:hypothetical protein